MSSYNLNTAFTNEQLATIYATGTNVIIAKPAGGANPNVAWQVFKPMNANTLSWDEEYGIYASTAQVVNGAVLSQLSSTPIPAFENKLYTLQDSGAITGPVTGGSPDSFGLLNQYSAKPYMTVGLFQDATINGTSILGNALSAAPVLLQSTAIMTPYTTVYIWLASQTVSNTVVTTVTSPMTKLVFGAGVKNISVMYDSASGYFMEAPGNAENSSTSSVSGQKPQALISHIEARL